VTDRRAGRDNKNTAPNLVSWGSSEQGQCHWTQAHCEAHRHGSRTIAGSGFCSMPGREPVPEGHTGRFATPMAQPSHQRRCARRGSAGGLPHASPLGSGEVGGASSIA